MTTTAVRPRPGAVGPGVPGAAGSRAMADLEAACAELVRRGRRARLVVSDLCGEPEARLVVRSPFAAREVELLGPCATVRLTGQWYAVRVGEQDRTIWRGPARPCPLATLVDFVETLLCRSERLAAARYQPMG